MMDTPTEKEHVHELIERLGPTQIATAARFLEFMLLDPVSRSIATAPLDDEPLTKEDVESIEASKEWFRNNKGIPHEEILAEFGLSPEGFPWNLGESDETPH
jgi:hypothetical protein